MAVNRFASGVMGIVDFAMLIWGSVVVFGAWANWTDDFEEYKTNPEELNFCHNTPMMTAFVILILKWVRVYVTDDFTSIKLSLLVLRLPNIVKPMSSLMLMFAGSDPRDDRHHLLLRLSLRLLLRDVRRRIQSAKSKLNLGFRKHQHLTLYGLSQ